MEFKFLVAVKMSLLVPWVVTPCEFIGRRQRFRDPQDEGSMFLRNLIPTYKFTRSYNSAGQAAYCVIFSVILFRLS